MQNKQKIEKKKISSSQSSRTVIPPRNKKPRYAPILISESKGIRYLHFGTEWIQGAMRIRYPYRIELAYGRQMMAWMLFVSSPKQIVQLGLGTGALAKFSYKHFPETKITAVELNPEVIEISKVMFAFPPEDDRLSVLEMDALNFVLDDSHKNSTDVIHVDLYDATARGPVLDTVEFYQACHDCLTQNGVMTVNLFGEHKSFQKNWKNIQKAFPYAIAMPKCPEGNVVVLAFKKEPDIDFEKWIETAKQIKQNTGLAALKWVRELKKVLKKG